MIVDLLDAAELIALGLLGWCFAAGTLIALAVVAITVAVTGVWPRLRR